MERLVLEALDWRLTFATPWDFVHFWIPHTERTVDKKGFKALCNVALERCVRGERLHLIVLFAFELKQLAFMWAFCHDTVASARASCEGVSGLTWSRGSMRFMASEHGGGNGF